jgi:dephospho-CoA kinase
VVLLFVLVVTGGIGSGKSEAARFFAAKGALVLDLDETARDIVLPDPTVRKHLVDAFGRHILRPDGAVSAPGLAEAAFSSEGGAARLNAIVHPAVTRALDAELARLRALPQAPAVVVVEVPLLAEAPHVREGADRVLALAAPAELRVGRAVERGMAETDARARLAAQATDAERAALADDVIVNDGGLDDLRRELQAYWEREVAPHAA